MVEVGELLIKVRGDIADVKTKLQQVENKLESVTKKSGNLTLNLQRFGMQLRRLSIAFSIIGGSIIFAMKKMIETAAQLDVDIGAAWSELTADIQMVMSELALDVSEVVIPKLAALWELVRNLIDKFLNMDEKTKDSIISFVFWAGIIGTVVGGLLGLWRIVTFLLEPLGQLIIKMGGLRLLFTRIFLPIFLTWALFQRLKNVVEILTEWFQNLLIAINNVKVALGFPGREMKPFKTEKAITQKIGEFIGNIPELLPKLLPLTAAPGGIVINIGAISGVIGEAREVGEKIGDWIADKINSRVAG